MKQNRKIFAFRISKIFHIFETSIAPAKKLDKILIESVNKVN